MVYFPCSFYKRGNHFCLKYMDTDIFSLRIELFRSLSDKNRFRYKAWRNEFFRVQSTFPQDAAGKAVHPPSDEMILSALSLPKFEVSREFHADDPKHAISTVIEDLGKALEHITSERLIIE
jgi:hypothetical protein